jgi:hypothetical protein
MAVFTETSAAERLSDRTLSPAEIILSGAQDGGQHHGQSVVDPTGYLTSMRPPARSRATVSAIAARFI